MEGQKLSFSVRAFNPQKDNHQTVVNLVLDGLRSIRPQYLSETLTRLFLPHFPWAKYIFVVSIIYTIGLALYFAKSISILSLLLIIVAPHASLVAVAEIMTLIFPREIEKYLQESLATDLKNIPAHYQQNENSQFFVAESESGEIIGTVALDFQPDSTKKKNTVVAELRRMSVKSQYRGAGVSKKLLQHLEVFAKEHGIKQIFLSTSSMQLTAMQLYERNGYKVTHKVFALPPFPVFIVFYEKLL